MEVRVYVGGLPLDVTSAELRERFGRFVGNAANCRLTNIELPKAKPIETFVSPETCRGFAYLTLEGAAAKAQSEKLQTTFTRTKWRGSLLKVQPAKPSFQHRLQCEWEEEAQKKLKQANDRLRSQQPVSIDKLQPLKLAVEFQGTKITRFVEVGERMNLKETETETERDINDTDEEVEETEATEYTVLKEDDVEDFVRKIQEVSKPEKTLTKEEVNARRLATLKAKQQRKSDDKSKIVIPRIGKVLENKKILFDDSGNEFELEQEAKNNGAIANWMDPSDDEADGDERRGRITLNYESKKEADAAIDLEAQAAFALRPEFIGEKGKKLFELQKHYGGDSRFRFDARFLEQEANEYGGNEVDEDEQDEDANIMLQRFLEEENCVAATRHACEMREEETAALCAISKLFPDVDVARLQRRLDERRAPKEPLKEAAWMGELRRYDPRDAHACREFELPMATTSLQAINEEEVTAGRQCATKEVLTGGDRYFSTSGALSSLFSRVRANSEDGGEGEAALDGVACAPKTDVNAPFKLSSLFSPPVGEAQSLAAMGEQLLEGEQTEATSSIEKWVSPQGFGDHDDDEAVATDTEASDEAEDDNKTKADGTSKQVKKNLEDFVAFGRTFVRSGDDAADWPERRKKLTLDFKRKRRDAVKMKKRSSKIQQTNATATRGTFKRKKTRL